MEYAEQEAFWTGHRERLRLRAKQEGFGALRPHEQMELLLYYAVPRVDMEDLARALTDALGPINEVLKAPPEALMAIPGMTKPVADWILMTGELLSAYTAVDRDAMFRIWRFRDLLNFLTPRWRQVRPPESWIIYTDFDDQLMTWDVICESLYWADPFYVRQIVKDALSMEARHAFLVMFVGTGPLEVEKSDRDFLVAMSRTLRAIEVELLDLVLVGEQGFYSLNMEGGMDVIRRECGRVGLHERYLTGEMPEPTSAYEPEMGYLEEMYMFKEVRRDERDR